MSADGLTPLDYLQAVMVEIWTSIYMELAFESLLDIAFPVHGWVAAISQTDLKWPITHAAF